MEIFILILSSLISVLSPANLAGDKALEGAVRSQFKQVEELKVRVDNAPMHNLLSGKVDRLRIAGRGFYPLEGVRIDTLEMETDPINVSFSDLRKGRYSLQAPLGVAVRVVIREEDMLNALDSPAVSRLIEQLLRGLNRNKSLDASADQMAQRGLRDEVENIRQTIERYRLSNPKVEFLEDRRVRIEATVEELATKETLQIAVETGVDILEGRRLQLLKPSVTVNGNPLPTEIVENLATNLARDLNLDRLENLLNVRARVFKAEFSNNSLEIAAFLGLPAGLRI